MNNPALKATSVSTHSRPKAAGFDAPANRLKAIRFNSQPPEGGWPKQASLMINLLRFQLTAARRRLGGVSNAITHNSGFNSQPPEGGWPRHKPAG